MSKQQSGGKTLPNDFAHGGTSATAPVINSGPGKGAPGGVGNNHNGHSRGKQGKG